jgi:cyclic pyranopterin phosphate synthase
MKDMLINIKRAARLIRVINYNPNTRYGPICLDIAVTSRCNHKCIFCVTHSILKPCAENPQDLDRGVLEDLLDDCVSLGVNEIVFAGDGEPLLYKGLPDIILKYGGKLDFRLLTNGTTLDLVTEKVFARLGKLTISMNAVSPDLHMIVHGYGGKSQYPRIRSNIERLLCLPYARRKIQVNYVICKENVHELPGVLELAREWDIYFAIRPASQGFPEMASSTLDAADICNIRGAIERAKQQSRSTRMKATLLHVEGACDIADNRIAHADVWRPCYFGFYWENIWSNGDYAHCVYSPKDTFGNLGNRRFRDLWSDARTQSAIYAATQMASSCKAVYPSCRGCPGPQMQSAPFHRLLGAIPHQTKLLKQHSDRYANMAGDR